MVGFDSLYQNSKQKSTTILFKKNLKKLLNKMPPQKKAYAFFWGGKKITKTFIQKLLRKILLTVPTLLKFPALLLKLSQ